MRCKKQYSAERLQKPKRASPNQIGQSEFPDQTLAQLRQQLPEEDGGRRLQQRDAEQPRRPLAERFKDRIPGERLAV